jgi:hypothetical protein
MSYWDTTQAKLSQVKKAGWGASSDLERHEALRFVNLQHTDDAVVVQMKTMYERHSKTREIADALKTSDLALLELGAVASLPKGEEFLHMVLGGSFNWFVGNTGFLKRDFEAKFPDYIQRRIKDSKVLWVTPKCKTTLDFDGVCNIGNELGLFHFGLVPIDVPIAVFHLRAKKDLQLLKPTWAHAFDGWYFDPAPECHAIKDPHGWARCLKTGNLLRKEWVVHPKQLADAFEVVSATLELDLSITPMGVDFSTVGPNYWSAIEKRIATF